MNEVQRFLSLFNQQVTHSQDVLDQIPSALWTSIPVDSETNYLGTRVNRITIEALVKHLVLAEDYWTQTLSRLVSNAAMAPPGGDTTLDAMLPGGALVNHYRQVHESNLLRITKLSDEQLGTVFTFIGRQYTVQGFLWVIYGHHSYHFGQVDLLLRQQSFMPPEFLELAERNRVIA